MPKGSGRRPLPEAVKKLRGNPGKRPLNDKEPIAPAGDPTMPRDLSKAGAAEWKRIIPELREMGVLSTIDRAALAAYCHAYARWFEAEKEVRRLGLVLREPIMGVVVLPGDDDEDRSEVVGYRYKKNPAVTISESAQKIMKSFLVEFGMTPSSRSRLSVSDNGKKAIDPAEQYFAQERPSQRIQ